MLAATEPQMCSIESLNVHWDGVIQHNSLMIIYFSEEQLCTYATDDWDLIENHTDEFLGDAKIYGVAKSAFYCYTCVLESLVSGLCMFLQPTEEARSDEGPNEVGAASQDSSSALEEHIIDVSEAVITFIFMYIVHGGCCGQL